MRSRRAARASAPRRRRHDDHDLAADALSRSPAPPRNTRTTRNSASPWTPIRATTSSCAARSSRARTARFAIRRTGSRTNSTPRISAPKIAAIVSRWTRNCRLAAAHHHQRLHRRGRDRRLWHRSRPSRAFVRPHVGEPRQRHHVPVHEHRPAGADQNQGPWARSRTTSATSRASQNKEVYVIAGVAGNKGTLKNEGRVVIPRITWKVALILPRDTGLSSVHDYRDVQVIAVIMPNEPGVRNVDWHTYQTTVDAVEALRGYDLLARSRTKWRRAGVDTQPPIAASRGRARSSRVTRPRSTPRVGRPEWRGRELRVELR